jgi:hypothetical protein
MLGRRIEMYKFVQVFVLSLVWAVCIIPFTIVYPLSLLFYMFLNIGYYKNYEGFKHGFFEDVRCISSLFILPYLLLKDFSERSRY